MTYSTTLDGAVSADQSELYVDDLPSAPIPPFVQIGDELMELDWVHGDFSTPVNPTRRIRLGVQRGVGGTARATHADTAAVTGVTGAGGSGGVTVTGSQGGSVAGATELLMAGSVFEGDPGQAVQGLIVQLLGPFTAAFNTPGLVNPLDNGAVLAAIPQGAIVVRAWAVTTIGWLPSDSAFDIRVGTPDGHATDVWSSLLEDEVADLSGDTLVEPTTGGIAPHVVTAVASDIKLMAQIIPETTDQTAGLCHVYALIVTPAS